MFPCQTQSHYSLKVEHNYQPILGAFHPGNFDFYERPMFCQNLLYQATLVGCNEFLMWMKLNIQPIEATTPQFLLFINTFNGILAEKKVSVFEGRGKSNRKCSWLVLLQSSQVYPPSFTPWPNPASMLLTMYNPKGHHYCEKSCLFVLFYKNSKPYYRIK